MNSIDSVSSPMATDQKMRVPFAQSAIGFGSREVKLPITRAPESALVV